VRQFFTVRFWMAIAALGGLAAAVWVIVPDDDAPQVDSSGDGVVERRIDLIEPLFAISGPSDFAMVDGTAGSDLALVIDGARNLRVVAGTPGEITCTGTDQVGQCAVAVDLLGDAVLWFSIFDSTSQTSIELPAIRELRDQSEVLLANDWVVRRNESVIRTCDEDTTSLGDFVRTFGDEAVSVWGVSEQQINRVSCRPT
jgi:hypothetical protein